MAVVVASPFATADKFMAPLANESFEVADGMAAVESVWGQTIL
jgi:hypothetical protein